MLLLIFCRVLNQLGQTGEVTFLKAMFRFSAIRPEVPSADKKPHPIKAEDKGTEGHSPFLLQDAVVFALFLFLLSTPVMLHQVCL